jgi:hypothetical protein
LERLEDRCVLSPVVLQPTTFLDNDPHFVPFAGNTATPTLRDAVMQANYDGAQGQTDTINLLGGTYNLTEPNGTGLDPHGSALVITAAVTIIGCNAAPRGFISSTTIHQTLQDRVLDISTPGLVRLQGYSTDRPLIISGGYAVNNVVGDPTPDNGAAEGGGIYNDGSGLVLRDVRVENNSARGGKGIADTVFTSGFDAFGGGIYSTGGSVVLTDSILNNNVAQAGDGSAGSADNMAGGNGGDAAGGGLYATNAATVTLDGVDQFLSNTAQAGNGGDRDLNSDSGQPIAGLGGGARGGGLCLQGLGTWLTQTSIGTVGVTVGGNIAAGGIGGNGGLLEGEGGWARGGGIDAYAGVTVDLSGTILNVISGNKAVGGAGAPAGATLMAQEDGGDGVGGGISASQNAVLNISNTFVLNNQAVGGAGDAPITPYGGWGGMGEGGGIAVGFIQNPASSDNSATLTMNGGLVMGNQADGGAGGGAADTNGGQGGEAAGGGLFLTDGSPALTGTVILFNRAVGGNGGNGATATVGQIATGGAGGAALGGGIADVGTTIAGTPTWTNLQVKLNVAQGGSGGTGSHDEVGADGGLASGGGLCFMNLGLLTLSGGAVDSNQTIGGPGGSGGGGSTPGGGGDGGYAQGGALLINGGGVLLSGTEMRLNSATGGSGGSGGKGIGTRDGNGIAGGPGGQGGEAQGGALYLETASDIISQAMMVGNVAQGGSGGTGGQGAAGVGNGRGGQGGAGGTGGLGQGGALFNASGVTNLDSDSLVVNTAQGGNGGNGGSGGVSLLDPRKGYQGAGGSGGDAQGGGAYVDTGTSLDLDSSDIITNFAIAGLLGSGHPSGAGGTASGGGVYNDGGVLLQAGTTLIIANLPDNIAP